MPKNFTTEQIVAHLTSQSTSYIQGTFSGQAEQLNQLKTTLEKRESQAPANSPEALALDAAHSALSRFLLTLPSLVNAIEYSMTRRVSELMQRALRQYDQFQHAYDELKENHPQIFQEPEFASFDRDYENAIFDGGGELLDMLDMSDKKYIPPAQPLDLNSMSLDFLDLRKPSADYLSRWYQDMDRAVSDVINKPMPFIMQPDASEVEVINQVYQINIANYYRETAGAILGNALNSLSDEELHAIYRNLKTNQTKRFITPDYIRQKLQAKDYSTIFVPSNWGRNQNEVYTAFIDALKNKPELLNQVVGALGQIKLPTDPAYPLPKEEPIDQAAIDNLRSVWTDPGDEELIQEASRIMTQVTKPVQAFMDKYSQNRVKGDESNIDKQLDMLSEKYTDLGMKTLDEGSYQNFLKPQIMDENTGKFAYAVSDPKFRPQKLEQENVDALKNTPTPFSPITMETAEEFMQVMDTMAFAGTSYTTDSTIRGYKPRREENGPYIVHDSEEGEKYYAFWPMTKAKLDVIDAVKTQNKEKLKDAVKRYKEEETKADKLMSLVNKEGLSKGLIFSGNVNATRENCVYLPAKYMTDYAGHNKVNSLYNLYAPLKNFGLSFREFAQDPVTTFEKMMQMYAEQNDLDSHAETTGSAFAWAKKNYSVDYQRIWDVMSTQFDRGIMGLVGLEPDPVKSQQFMAKLRLAQMNVHTKLERELQLIDALEAIQTAQTPEDSQKRNLLYQHALLFPDSGENRFNLKKFVEKTVDDPNWSETLSLESELTAEKIAQMNLAELAARPDRILQQLDEARIRDRAYTGSFSKDDFLLNTYGLYSRILQNVPENMRNTPGYQAMKQTLESIPGKITDEKSKALAGTLVRLSGIQDPFNDLQTRKTEFFNSSDDSNEYTTMKESIAVVQNSIRSMRNLGTDPSINLNTLRTPGIADQLAKAAEDTFEYARLKTKNGTKTSFRNTSGTLRYEESLLTLNKIHELQDQLGLRSPAQKLYDDCRISLLQNRKNKAWMQHNAMRTVTKMIYAKQFIDSDIPADMQRSHFTEESVNTYTQRMMSRQPVRRYVFLTDEGKLARQALEGNETFSEICQQYTQRMTTQYEETKQRKTLKQISDGVKTGFAMDIAANQLGLIRGDDPRIDGKNPQLKELADQIKQDPEFVEVMNYMLKGKNNSVELKAMHAVDEPIQRVDSRLPGYEQAKSRIRFEKKYAEKIVSLFPQESASPIKRVETIRKDPRFVSLMDQELTGKNPQEIQKMTEDLNKPEVSQQIMQKVMHIAAPPAPAAPQGPAVLPNQLQVGQEGQPVQNAGGQQEQPQFNH